MVKLLVYMFLNVNISESNLKKRVIQRTALNGHIIDWSASIKMNMYTYPKACDRWSCQKGVETDRQTGRDKEKESWGWRRIWKQKRKETVADVVL